MTTRTCFNADGTVNTTESRINQTWGTTHFPGWEWDYNYQQRWQRFGAITHKAIFQTHFYFSFIGPWAATNHMYPCLQMVIQGTSGTPTAYNNENCYF
jgi:hypothetical protein